ncbi:(Dimethylallyl)adenosine tRNA methylthiotransferase MiaB [Corynebacterium freneyi]|nr:(Dimethylallyl)adenosine tRNA methylthiotransferase MiaB [Corynebacterium freneyi]
MKGAGRAASSSKTRTAVPTAIGEGTPARDTLSRVTHASPTTENTAPAAAGPRTYEVRTFGCQMNVHDSERLSGLLEDNGYIAVAEGERPDLVVFNTCAVRENADNRLYGTLGRLKPVKDEHPDMQIAVGGCLAQKDKAAVVKKAPWVDVVFGTHNLGSLPTLLERAAHNHEAQVEIKDALEDFPSVLPAKRESPYAGWVSVSVGCNNTCTFCIVPSLRGKERDRRPGDILAEVQALVDQGVTEVTLLGQNVNAYGVHFDDPELERDRSAFSKLLRACGEIEGLERVRFTSPHPAEFTDDVIDAMADTPNVAPQLHMPLQSGSDKVLKEMRRSYRSKKFLGILDKVRERMPHAAITTDIIVGFPGETEEDFQATLDVVERARFTSAFTFQYSPRPGTPAADMPDQVPPHVVKERYGRLIELQERISEEENAKQVGRTLELLVTADDGKKNAETRRMSGRAVDGRLVHFAPVAVDEAEGADSLDDAGRPHIDGEIRPGDFVTVTVTESAPHFLIADSGVTAHRRTRAGDMWEAGNTPTTAPIGVGLGLPGVGRPSTPAVNQTMNQDRGCGCD